VPGWHFFWLEPKETKVQEKIKLLRSLGFLNGLRITAAQA